MAAKSIKRCKTHKCMAATLKTKEQCKNGVMVNYRGNHVVIWYENQWATLCSFHFGRIFDFILNSGPVKTNEAYCATSER